MYKINNIKNDNKSVLNYRLWIIILIEQNFYSNISFRKYFWISEFENHRNDFKVSGKLLVLDLENKITSNQLNIEIYKYWKI